MAWYSTLGWGIFWVGLILSIILFSIKKKFYPVLYLVSISLYVFTVGFVIDVFDLTKNWILLVLAISSGLMIFLGIHISKQVRDNVPGPVKEAKNSEIVKKQVKAPPKK